jgi:RNA polymerase sigma-70 factor, ECF subfamily
LPKNLEYRVTDINGKAGVVSYLNGKPYLVLTVEVREGLIQSIYIVSNPDKLAHVPALAGADSWEMVERL